MAKVLNVIGQSHIFEGKNNQDYYVLLENVGIYESIKIVLDGCGEGKNSEVGVKLFATLLEDMFGSEISHEKFQIQASKVLQKMCTLCQSGIFINDHFMFTILAVFETEDEYITLVCGDGYIIAVTNELEIEYKEFDYENFPKYLMYNLLVPECRGKYADGVTFDKVVYSKNEYQNIGVATDGYRFVFELPKKEKIDFEEMLKSGRLGRVQMVINRNRSKFSDDITICI